MMSAISIRSLVLVVVATAGLGTGVASAHHSFSMFDQTKTVALAGTVKEWQWTNPHTWLILTAKDEKGDVHEWRIEGQSPQVLRGEQGLSRSTFKPGDQVTVTIHPMRDGSFGGSFMGASDAAGRKLGQQPQPPAL